jgi:DNA-binding NarL/FixJ family response regulator
MIAVEPGKEVTVEEIADDLIGGVEKGPRVYTERQLARKIRLEDARMSRIDETAMPDRAADYLLRKQLQQEALSARLTKAQAALLALVIEGWSAADISQRFGMSYDNVRRRLRLLKKRLESGGSPYDGLYEVYWREVHRYVYRK